MTEYQENAGLTELVKKVLDDQHKHELDAIREQELKIDAVLKVKTSKEGDNQPCGGPPANVTKVSGLWTTYCDARYVLVFDNYFFTTQDDNKIEGMIFNALQTIDVKIVKGEIKLAKKRPDIELFAATVAHYGADITESMLVLKEVFKNGTQHFLDTHVNGKLEETSEEPTSPEKEPAAELGDKSEPACVTSAEAPRRGGRKK